MFCNSNKSKNIFFCFWSHVNCLIVVCLQFKCLCCVGCLTWCFCLQVIWNTSPSWSPGACWRCWSTSTSGPVKKQSASLTSWFQCWRWSQKREPQPQNVCATPGSPSSGDLQPLHTFLSSLSLSLQRLQQITFQFGHIRWLFISLFVSLFLDYLCFVIELMLLCMLALYVLVLLCVPMWGISRFILFCDHICSNCCALFTHPWKQTCIASDWSLFLTLLH